jgi:flagellar biosynthesis/type III secretory pathway protein FliH
VAKEEEPPIREFADRGTLWLLEAPQNLRGLLRLVAAEIAEPLDFARAERINRSFVPDDLHKQEADQSVENRHAREVQEMAMTDAQVLLAQGRREGLREGREEGRRALFRAQLEHKFGPLPAETLAVVEALAEPQLNEMAVRILTASTLADLGL